MLVSGRDGWNTLEYIHGGFINPNWGLRNFIYRGFINLMLTLLISFWGNFGLLSGANFWLL